MSPEATEGLCEPRSRRLDWPDCQNTRDLGGLPRNGGATRFGVLVRSDTLGLLTDEGREAMETYGITTVIDLRSPSELNSDTAKRARVKNVKYIHRPLVDDANMRKLGEASNMYERYLMMLNNRPHAFRDVFNSIADADGPVVFHCFAGKDRTGLIAAMLLSIGGVPSEHIGTDFAETDKQLAKKYEEWIAGAELEKHAMMRDELRCPPERILGVLDYLEQKWGGVASYLEAAGTKPRNIDRLGSRLAS